jgi:hypothetical protein
MNSYASKAHACDSKRTALNHIFLTLACGALVGLNIGSCLAEQPYNPDKLSTVQLESVSQICQTVMGLSPNEALSSGHWLGNSRLDYDTSHYRGCILSLSDSLQSVTDAEVTRQAEENCRAKGLEPGSPELALCVLRFVNSNPNPPPAQSAVPAAAITGLVPPKRSFFTASPRETGRREQAACAALGLSPAQSTFKSCVKQLDNTLYSIDHPID